MTVRLEGVYFRLKISSPANRPAGNLWRRKMFLPQFFRDQRKRNSCQKEKKRRRKSPTQLGIHEKPALPRPGGEPGIVAMSLKHQHASQSAHPVDIREAGLTRFRCWHGQREVWRPHGSLQPQMRRLQRRPGVEAAVETTSAVYGSPGRGERPPIITVTVLTLPCKIFPQYNPTWNKLDPTSNP